MIQAKDPAMRSSISLALATLLLASIASAEVPRVVTDIAPVHSLVAMVMGDLGTPDLLVDKGADSHSFQLRPSQASSLQDADLIIWIGPEMTPWLDRTLDGLETNATRIDLLAATVTQTRSYADEGAHDHTAEPKPEDRAHDGTDPHAWLDPHNAAQWLALIAAELAILDPENAATYAANAATGTARIAATEAEITNLLAPVKAKPFVVYHDAYGYFTAYFGLTVAGEIALGDASSPSAAKLAALRATLAAASATCIFPETNHDPKLLIQLAEGTPIRTGAALDPEGANLSPGPGLYPALLRALAATLSDCLSTR